MARKRRSFFRRRRPEGEDFVVRPRRKFPLKKGIFILPSLFTLGSIFLAFYAIIAAIEGKFAFSAVLIIAAGFFDGIDGKVARLTNTQTRFGLELDSLADVISFGVAPAVMMYMWALKPMGEYGWVSAFLFVACGALRLARFNVQSGTIDPKRFNGLPIPGAAAVMATVLLIFWKMEWDVAAYRTHLLVLNTVMALLMVSSIKFHAFKDLTFAKKKPFASTVGFVLLLALLALWPIYVTFIIMAGYVIHGPILTVFLYVRNRNKPVETLENERLQTQISVPPPTGHVVEPAEKTVN